ncbi:MAG: site-specific integrase, partial [Lachnospiraceae bacterium]|nr:site-specific integrase [Lachnospiraceae bacterium]
MATDKRGRKLPRGIRQRSDNFEGRFTYKGQSYTVQGATIGETQKAMNDLRYKLEHGLFVVREKITFEDWFKTWMEEYKKPSVKAGTYDNYWKYYRCAIGDRLGKRLISDIRVEHIQKIYNDLVNDKGYTVSSIGVISAVLGGCFSQAEKNGLIERNPVRLATLPRKEANQKKGRQAMTKEQQKIFMEYAQESYCYNLFALMLRTGMRRGEVQGLKWSDVDKEKGVLHVRRTLKHIPERGYFEDTPKTKTSLRDIPLTDDIMAILEAQRNFWGFKVERLDRYLFCNEEGEILTAARIQGEVVVHAPHAFGFIGHGFGQADLGGMVHVAGHGHDAVGGFHWNFHGIH